MDGGNSRLNGGSPPENTTRRGTPSSAAKASRNVGYRSHGRTVSYEDLHHMGLSRAVDEYHKLLTKAKASGGMQGFCKGPEHCVAKIFKCFLFCPVYYVFKSAVLVHTWKLVARVLHVFTFLIVPLLMSFCMEPSLLSSSSFAQHIGMNTWNATQRLTFAGIISAILHVADRTVSFGRHGSSIHRSLSFYYGESLPMSSRVTDVKQLPFDDTRTINDKETEVIQKVKKLVLRYGFFTSEQECEIENMDAACRWINKLARELEETQFTADSLSVETALEATRVLGEAIGMEHE
mmetsp:Transcript_7180/g.14358  ORF Transcript_7180/g.14358 Transcript_7180/m.14358 type:complete len:292 (+) Transcript_7180:180-1055(+)